MRSLALASLVLPALSLAAPAVKAPSRIDGVTVYRTGARVTRAARAELPARRLVERERPWMPRLSASWITWTYTND